MHTYTLLHGKKGVKALYIDGEKVCTWDKTMDPRDLERAIARRVGSGELVEQETDHRKVTDFPEFTYQEIEPVVEIQPAPMPQETPGPTTLVMPQVQRSRDDMTPAEKRKDTLAKKAADKVA